MINIQFIQKTSLQHKFQEHVIYSGKSVLHLLYMEQSVCHVSRHSVKWSLMVNVEPAHQIKIKNQESISNIQRKYIKSFKNY